MNIYLRLVGLLIISIALFSACDDNKVTNIIGPETAIIGRVIPASSGTTVSAWQADMVAEAATDSAGFFSISGLPAGIYELRIQTSLGLNRRIPNIVVEGGKTLSLGEIMIEGVVYPLLSIFPPNGSIDVATAGLGPILRSAERIDLAAFPNYITLSPLVAGSWTERNSRGIYTYRFVPDVQLANLTNYTFAISSRLTFMNGDLLGTDITAKFSTSAFLRSELNWRTFNDPNTIQGGFTGTLVTLGFTSVLDPATVSNAVSIIPVVAFQTTLDRDERFFTIFVSSGIVSGISYQIVIDRSLRDISGAMLSKPDTVEFAAERFMLISKSVRNSQDDIEPRTRSTLISFDYNAPIEQSSIQSSVSISPPLDIVVSSSFGGSRRLFISPNEDLRPSTEYTFIISASLATVGGANIGLPDTTILRTQPLKLLRFGVSPSSFSSSLDTLIPANRNFDYRVFFNATVDADSMAAASSFDHGITGLWINGTARRSSSPEPFVWFFPTSTSSLDLEPGEVYVLTIDNSIGLVESTSLDTPVALRVRTLPLEITSVSPSNGSSGISTYADPHVSFNAVMNRSSVESAFTMQSLDGITVTGIFRWSFNRSDEVTFNPNVQLTSNQVYVVQIDTTASSLGGKRLSKPLKSVFRIR